MSRGRLYLVATPIGNLGDVSPRAREVLGSVDRVLAEDTRHSGRLLSALGISRPMLSLHEHNEQARLAVVLEELEGGARLALVSDAGTPAISDPGCRLVRAAREAGIDVESVAGPSALAAALAASGFPAEPTLFLGFPPPRSAARKRFLGPWKSAPATLVLYEAPHRIEASLADAIEVLGAGRRAILLRELTKLHEEGIDGTLGSIAAEIASRGGVKGELVLVVAPPEETAPAAEGEVDLAAAYAAALAAGLPKKEALRKAAQGAGRTRGEAYRELFGPGSDDAE